ncbi:MAG: serine/threonine-protein kinase, partial [Myxococcota bacterium]
MLIEPGTEVGGFRVLSLLAEGGMGIVYRAEEIGTGRLAALKVLRAELRHRREDVGRFIREAMISKNLYHPNLVEFFDSGFDVAHGFFMATELLDGQDLEEVLRENNNILPLEEVLDVLLQVCAGLEVAHQQEIIHRDLKPANIFLVEREGQQVVKVFDFGIGKMLGQEVGGKLTHLGVSVGTPLYMSPEQIKGGQQIGQATDIYALGVIAHQLITGKVPFSGQNQMMIMAAHLREKPPLLRKWKRSFAGTALEDLLIQMLAKEVVDRPRSLVEVRERLWEVRRQISPEEYAPTRLELPSFSKGTMSTLMMAAQREEDSIASEE